MGSSEWHPALYDMSTSSYPTLVLSFLFTVLPLVILSKPIASSSSNLCGDQSLYCENPPNYPYEVILMALRNQSELVNTPGLFDSLDDLKEYKDTLDDLKEYKLPHDLDYGDAVDLIDNGIVPY